MPWHTSSEQRLSALEQVAVAGLFPQFVKEKKKPQPVWLSDEAWRLLQQQRAGRGQLRRTKDKYRRSLLRAIFLAWPMTESSPACAKRLASCQAAIAAQAYALMTLDVLTLGRCGRRSEESSLVCVRPWGDLPVHSPRLPRSAEVTSRVLRMAKKLSLKSWPTWCIMGMTAARHRRRGSEEGLAVRVRRPCRLDRPCSLLATDLGLDALRLGLDWVVFKARSFWSFLLAPSMWNVGKPLTSVNSRLSWPAEPRLFAAAIWKRDAAIQRQGFHWQLSQYLCDLGRHALLPGCLARKDHDLHSAASLAAADRRSSRHGHGLCVPGPTGTDGSSCC